jgi:phosphoglycolate phosphatase
MIRAKLIVFDLDGTLVDSIGDIATAVADALREIAPGVEPPGQAQIHSFVGEGAAVLIARSLAAAGLDRRVEEVLPLYLDAYRRRLLDTTRFYPGALEALDALRDRTLCVLSNKPGDLSRALLAGLGAAPRFARIWGGGDAPGRKPDPAGLLRLMSDFAATAGETVMVGDSAVDIATGRAAGVFTVGVSLGFDPRGVVAARPDAVIDNLRDLAPLLHAREAEGDVSRPL